VRKYKIFRTFVPKILTKNVSVILGTVFVSLITILMFNLSFHGY